MIDAHSHQDKRDTGNLWRLAYGEVRTCPLPTNDGASFGSRLNPKDLQNPLSSCFEQCLCFLDQTTQVGIRASLSSRSIYTGRCSTRARSRRTSLRPLDSMIDEQRTSALFGGGINLSACYNEYDSRVDHLSSCSSADTLGD